ncbi:hypothetical protein ACJX0J_035512 [Zea mays]
MITFSTIVFGFICTCLFLILYGHQLNNPFDASGFTIFFRADKEKEKEVKGDFTRGTALYLFYFSTSATGGDRLIRKAIKDAHLRKFKNMIAATLSSSNRIESYIKQQHHRYKENYMMLIQYNKNFEDPLQSNMHVLDDHIDKDKPQDLSVVFFYIICKTSCPLSLILIVKSNFNPLTKLINIVIAGNITSIYIPRIGTFLHSFSLCFHLMEIFIVVTTFVDSKTVWHMKDGATLFYQDCMFFTIKRKSKGGSVSSEPNPEYEEPIQTGENNSMLMLEMKIHVFSARINGVFYFSLIFHLML